VFLASRMAVGVYRRLGFHHDCTIGQYIWSPKPAWWPKKPRQHMADCSEEVCLATVHAPGHQAQGGVAGGGWRDARMWRMGYDSSSPCGSVRPPLSRSSPARRLRPTASHASSSAVPHSPRSSSQPRAIAYQFYYYLLVQCAVSEQSFQYHLGCGRPAESQRVFVCLSAGHSSPL